MLTFTIILAVVSIALLIYKSTRLSEEKLYTQQLRDHLNISIEANRELREKWGYLTDAEEKRVLQRIKKAKQKDSLIS